MEDEQIHPLYIRDRVHVDRMLSKESPNSDDLIDLARLFIRYEDFLGASDLKSDLFKILKNWDLDRDVLNSKTRQIWLDGFVNNESTEKDVGSGFDTSDSTNL